ncbi:lipopolysaccharide biosynthesis protein [Maritalea porphyrae]|uniref:lipopolysaccharide biosynthesis protein n=1 Tax=Maritalea porphyrae TaxID=880732 RepID=UPI0022AFDA41|nr:polysaccharide biosynthesis C-terminal domain-containing protein [Maritalea porphyrae]MCZ4271071.1 polysaccharide biosynthesis C-terminal domain-containing protein [Maritalea porphyrae]
MKLRQQLASKSAILFAVRIAGAGTIFLAQAGIARLWGSAQLGEYLIAIATINLLAIVLPLGMQTVGSYFAAEYAAKGDGRGLRAFTKLAYGLILFPGIALAYLAGLIAPLIGETGTHLADLWFPISLMAIGSAVFFVNAGILVGLKRPFVGFFADTIFRPILVVLSLFLAFAIAAPGENIVVLLWGLALSYCVVIFAQSIITVRQLCRLPVDENAPAPDWRRWLYFSLPWIIITLSTDFFFDADLLILANLLSKEQIAVFGVCTRIFVLASYGITAVYAVTMPGMLEDVTKNDMAGLGEKIGDANLLATGLALVLTLIIAIASPLVLSLFGKDFSGGYWPLVILCTSLVVRSAFGPGPLILSARNRPYASLPAVGVGLGTLLLANFILVPLWGLVGAAFAAILSYLCGSMMVWHTTKRITGSDVSIWPALARLVASRA